MARDSQGLTDQEADRATAAWSVSRWNGTTWAPVPEATLLQPGDAKRLDDGSMAYWTGGAWFAEGAEGELT